jgi:DNA end-binding protein Ku
MRAMWRGVIELEGFSVPVKLYSAVQPHSEISFTLVHAKDLVPLKQVLVNSATGEPVPAEHVTKGYALTKRKYIKVDPERVKALAPEGDRNIEVLRTVERDAIDPRYFVRPYFLGPDGNNQAYSALAAAFAQSGRLALVRWVMRRSAYSGALFAEDGVLMLMTLREAEQVVHRKQSYSGVELDERELKTARYLVEALTGEFKPEEFRDEYRGRVEQLIASKAAGKKIAKAAPKAARAKGGALLELLEASLKEARGRSGSGRTAQRRGA